MKGKFHLYGSGREDLDSSMTVAILANSDVDARITPRVERASDLASAMFIMYRGEGDLHASITTMESIFINATIEVRPHNQMYGRFELLEAPRIDAVFPPVADATTRSRSDLQTINYGDMQRMLVGSDKGESFDSFIHFGRLQELIPDLFALEKAKLKIYYSGVLPDNATIQLHQPNTYWSEMGVTHANKPYSVELLSSEYSLNRKDQYIEFDVLSIAKRWQDGSLFPYGFIIKSPDDYAISFYTRESGRPPQLEFRYVSDLVYSIGRTETDATILIVGVGSIERAGRIVVRDYIGMEYFDSTIFVHRPEDPVWVDTPATIGSSRRALHSILTVGVNDEDDLAATIAVAIKAVESLDSYIRISHKEKSAVITVDRNASLESFMWVPAKTETEGCLYASIPHMLAEIEVSAVRMSELPATLTVKTQEESDLKATIRTSLPFMDSSVTIRVSDQSDLNSRFHIPFYREKDGFVRIAIPFVQATIEVTYENSLDSAIYVPYQEDVNACITIHQHSQLVATLDVRTFSDIDSTIAVSVPEIHAFLYPRIKGEDDLDAFALIRQRDASDLHSRILLKGTAKAYYYIL